MWRRYVQQLDDDDGDPLGPPLLWPDGRHIAASGLGRIFLWDLATGAGSRVLTTEAICRDGTPSFQLACEPELGRVLTGHRIREFACWDSQAWQRLMVFDGHIEEVQAARFVADDRIMSISGDSTARLWDAWTGACLRVLDTYPVYAIADNPAQGRLAIAGASGSVWVVDRLQLTVMATFTLPLVNGQHQPLSEELKRQIGIVWNRPTSHIGALVWHPDGEHLLCGRWDFVPKMLDARTGRVVQMWHGHAHWVDAITVEPIRQQLVTGSSDGTVRVWSLGSPECLAVYDLGHASLGGLLVHEGAIYATCGRELVVLPLPA